MILFVVLIILIILLIYYITYKDNTEYLLNGFWLGDSDFCENAELNLFMLYLGEKGSSGIPGYIIIKNYDGIILNQPFDLDISKSISMGGSEINYSVKFNWLEPDQNFYFFPTIQSMTYYPVCGKIILFKDDEIYAVLFKDNVLTENTLKKSSMPQHLLDASADLSDI